MPFPQAVLCFSSGSDSLGPKFRVCGSDRSFSNAFTSYRSAEGPALVLIRAPHHPSGFRTPRDPGLLFLKIQIGALQDILFSYGGLPEAELGRP